MGKDLEQILLFSDNIIKKSNEITTAKMMQGLSINQMRLLAFAMLQTQKNNQVEFTKREFEEQFGIEKYTSKDAHKDGLDIFKLTFGVLDMAREEIDYIHVFDKFKYGYREDGKFKYKWHEDILPHILELKERYVLLDLDICANFKSNFSWLLYEKIKAKYGRNVQEFTTKEMLEFFNVEDKESYQTNVGDFRKRVLDRAIKEVNEYTEYSVDYEALKAGRKIKGFKLRWQKNKGVFKTLTIQQQSYIEDILSDLKTNIPLKLLDMTNQDLIGTCKMMLKEALNVKYDNISMTEADKVIKFLNEKRQGILGLIQADLDKQAEKESQFYQEIIDIPDLSEDWKNI